MSMISTLMTSYLHVSYITEGVSADLGGGLTVESSLSEFLIDTHKITSGQAAGAYRLISFLVETHNSMLTETADELMYVYGEALPPHLPSPMSYSFRNAGGNIFGLPGASYTMLMCISSMALSEGFTLPFPLVYNGGSICLRSLLLI